ncbi:hypothetical protein LZ30DRAFT_253579 [Colletotrichum cereale]|nr:hypothetical protein LZ30DRAFT_253579 [Colletotrichum cereale]
MHTYLLCNSLRIPFARTIRPSHHPTETRRARSPPISTSPAKTRRDKTSPPKPKSTPTPVQYLQFPPRHPLAAVHPSTIRLSQFQSHIDAESPNTLPSHNIRPVLAPATLATLARLSASHCCLPASEPAAPSNHQSSPPPAPPVFKTQSASHILTDPLLPPSSLLPHPSSKLQTALSAHLAIPSCRHTHPLSSKSKREEKSTRSARHFNDRLLPPFPSPLFF